MSLQVDFAQTIRKLATTAKLKADLLDEQFLKTADPRAVQGGATCEIADAWRATERALRAAAFEVPEED